MKEAFTYLFKDPGFKNKAGVYAILIGLIAICNCFTHQPININNSFELTNSTSNIALTLFKFIVYIFVVGYYLNIIKAISEQKTNIVLPFFNIKCGIKALKYLLAITLAFVAFTSITLLFGILGEIYSHIFAYAIISFYVIYAISFLWLFAKDEDILTFFDFKSAINYVKQSPKNYFKHVGLIIIVSILGAAFTLLIEYLTAFISLKMLSIGIYSVISAIIETYIGFTTAYLIAKSIKIKTVV